MKRIYWHLLINDKDINSLIIKMYVFLKMLLHRPRIWRQRNIYILKWNEINTLLIESNTCNFIRSWSNQATTCSQEVCLTYTVVYKLFFSQSSKRRYSFRTYCTYLLWYQQPQPLVISFAHLSVPLCFCLSSQNSLGFAVSDLS